VSERYINKKCQNCGSLRGVDHANECDCCGGDVWVFVCSKHQLFSLTTTSCPLCETEFSYSSQEKKWISTQELIKSGTRPYKTFLIFGIIFGSVLMYYVRNLELYESKQAQVKRQILATQTSQLEAVNTKLEESKKLLTIVYDNFAELDQENKKLNENLYRYKQSAAADEALIDDEVLQIDDEVLQLKGDIQKLTVENREIYSISARPKNTQKQPIVDTNRYYKYDELDKKPIVVVKSAPINPKRSLFSPSSGSTRVKLLIDENGRIVNTEVINSTHRKFTKATLEALEEWVFAPGEKQGIKVKVEMELNFPFPFGDAKWDSL